MPDFKDREEYERWKTERLKKSQGTAIPDDTTKAKKEEMRGTNFTNKIGRVQAPLKRPSSSHRSSRDENEEKPPRLLGVLIMVLGVTMMVGGIVMVWMNGGLYFLTIGLGIACSGSFLFSGKKAGTYIYGATLAVIVGWSLIETREIGVLLARVALPTLIGLYLLSIHSRLSGFSNRGMNVAMKTFIAITALIFLGGLITAGYRGFGKSPSDVSNQGPSASTEKEISKVPSASASSVVPVQTKETTEREWLSGTWELASSKSNEPKDSLVFDENGNVTVIAADGRNIPGTYSMSNAALVIDVNVEGRDIAINLNISKDRTRLEVFDNAGVLQAHYAKK